MNANKPIPVEGISKTHKFIENLPNGNKLVRLSRGLEVGGKKQMTIELSEPTLGDMLKAERAAPMTIPMNYRTALLANNVVKIGDYEGIPTLEIIERLKNKDYYRLIDALNEYETEGED